MDPFKIDINASYGGKSLMTNKFPLLSFVIIAVKATIKTKIEKKEKTR